MRGHIRPKRAVTMPKWLVTMGRNTHFGGRPLLAMRLPRILDGAIIVYFVNTLSDKEAKMMEALAQGKSTLELMGLTRWR